MYASKRNYDRNSDFKPGLTGGFIVGLNKPGLTSGFIVSLADLLSLPNRLLIANLLQSLVAHSYFLFKHLQRGRFQRFQFLYNTHHWSVGYVAILLKALVAFLLLHRADLARYFE